MSIDLNCFRSLNIARSNRKNQSQINVQGEMILTMIFNENCKESTALSN